MQINRQLLKDCAKGKRKAQFELYKSCYSTLMQVCMRYKKNENDAAASLNEGFLKILNNLNKYREEVPFEAWIRRIMINTIIDEFRKNKKQLELIEHTNFENEEMYLDHTELNEADLQFDAAELEAIIHQLPPMSQKVFNLYAIDGYTHKEIAEMLKISAGTSKWHLNAARTKIKSLLQEHLKHTK